jgi:hypothetical protein
MLALVQTKVYYKKQTIIYKKQKQKSQVNVCRLAIFLIYIKALAELLRFFERRDDSTRRVGSESTVFKGVHAYYRASSG